MSFKIEHGTVNESRESLCLTCRMAMLVTAARPSDDRVFCRALSTSQVMPVVFVASCSVYDDKRRPSLWDMQQIAWMLTSDRQAKRVGFVSPQDWAEKQSVGMPAPTVRGKSDAR